MHYEFLNLGTHIILLIALGYLAILSYSIVNKINDRRRRFNIPDPLLTLILAAAAIILWLFWPSNTLTFSLPEPFELYRRAFDSVRHNGEWGMSIAFWAVVACGNGLWWVNDQYTQYQARGPGGSPSTFEGWYVSNLRALCANVDKFTALAVPQMVPVAQRRGRLNPRTFPRREGERPSITGITPQRQVNFLAPPNMPLQLQEVVNEFVQVTGQDRIEVVQSYLEPGLQALRRRIGDGVTPTDQAALRARFNTVDEFGGELFHVHLSEATVHASVHIDDARVIIENGWGERHPFATASWAWRMYWHWWKQIRLPVPLGLVILYAPRHQGEVNVIREVIRACVWNGTEGRLYPLNADTYPIPPAPEGFENFGLPPPAPGHAAPAPDAAPVPDNAQGQ
ncbi:hypothetical protein F5Y16DRAFT_377147 [Xylariaceae sp. FL0255]|nr:hypothetical protein F5Y16DRAFT_377147 [Xylariaceae sp. FL0255]